MKIRFLAKCRDRHNYAIVYNPGETADFDEERAMAAIERGLAKEVSDENRGETDAPEVTPEASNAKEVNHEETPEGGAAAATEETQAETPKTETAKAKKKK